MSNIVNKIVANVKQSNNTTSNYINSNNIVCIDTSSNRIGINTKNPRYSIDVSNSSSLNNENITIFTPILQTISGIITNISSTDIICNNKITSTNLTVTGKTDLSTLIIDSIDFSNTSYQGIILEIGSNNDLSTNKFFINEISSNNIISRSIILNGDLSYNPGGKPLDIYCSNLYGNIEPQKFTTKLLNATTISGNSLTITSDASFLLNVFISGELSCNSIKVTTISADSVQSNNESRAIKFEGQNADFSYIHTISLEFVDTISGKTLKLLNTEISNNIITTNISANHLFINDISINSSIQFNPNTIINSDFSNRNIMDISNGRCILPNVISDDISSITNGFTGEIIFTTDNQVLNIWDGSQYKQLVLGNDFANFKLNTTISGNDISYNLNNSIDYSNNLLIGSSNDFKLIPLIFDSSANNSNFGISSYIDNRDLPCLIDITHSEFNNKLIEVNANISLRFINKVPGDVEACTYEFILFDSSSDLLKDVNVNTDIALVSIKNTMLVIDNSFNFSNSNLTYILNNTETNYLYFCIAANSKQDSETNLNYLSIDSFHCSIKTI